MRRLKSAVIYRKNIPEDCSGCGKTLSFSVLITVGLLIKGGMKGAIMEASTRVIGMSVGKAACSIASLSMVSQKSSTCTSSDTENSGQVNCRKVTRGHNKRAHSQTHIQTKQPLPKRKLWGLNYSCYHQTLTSTFLSSRTLFVCLCAISIFGATPQMPQIISL